MPASTNTGTVAEWIMSIRFWIGTYSGLVK